MRPKFYEAGAFQVVAKNVEKGRNNASNHTGSPCPCKIHHTCTNFVENVIKTKTPKKQYRAIKKRSKDYTAHQDEISVVV